MTGKQARPITFRRLAEFAKRHWGLELSRCGGPRALGRASGSWKTGFALGGCFPGEGAFLAAIQDPEGDRKASSLQGDIMKPFCLADKVQLDPLRLVDSRMLIQANSGGGKSWLLRLVAEQAAGHIQTIILDPEGEFATLREQHDFLLVGHGGEIPCESRSATLLARRLLELQASAVIDLYDLKLPERRRFVRLFLDALMHLPKPLWRPLLVMLDESHLFCPERSAGEAESTSAVIDLMSQGRKRSYCGILATQRLSKLHKDAEAECNNVLIGRSWLDIDQKRAGALLGMDAAARQELRDLEPGQFIGFGPALSANGVVRFRAAQVQTSHPKAGQRHKLSPPKPSEAVRRIVADLADLPQQAEAEVRDLAGAKKQIAELQQQLRARPTETQTVEKEVKVEVPVLKNAQLEQFESLIRRLEAAGQPLMSQTAELRRLIEPTFWPGPLRSGTETGRSVAAKPTMRGVPKSPAKPCPELTRVLGTLLGPSANGDAKVGKGGLYRILVALAQRPGLTKRQIGLRAGLSSHSGTFSTYISQARKAGWMRDHGDDRQYITDEGLAALGSYDPLPEGPALLQHWKNELGGGAARMLQALVDVHPNSLTPAQLAEAVGMSQSGTYSTYLSRMRTLELVEGRGELRASQELI